MGVRRSLAPVDLPVSGQARFNAPKRVTRGSFTSLKLTSNSRSSSGSLRRISSASTAMVRSLNASNSLLRPITRRRWNAGPPSWRRTTSPSSRTNGPSKSNRKAAPRMSIVLFRICPLRVIEVLVREAGSVRFAPKETATAYFPAVTVRVPAPCLNAFRSASTIISISCWKPTAGFQPNTRRALVASPHR